MIQEIIWRNISVAGMALFTIGVIIVIVCIGVGFMLHIKHKRKKADRTGRHVPGSSGNRGRITPDSELGRKLIGLDFHINPGRGYEPLVETQNTSTSPTFSSTQDSEIVEPIVDLFKPIESSSEISVRGPISIPPVVPATRPPAIDTKTTPSSREADFGSEKSAETDSAELSPEEQDAILKIQEMLGLPTARVVLSVPQIEAILACGRALQKELKPITPKNVVLDAGENAFFEFQVDLLDSPTGGGVRLHFPPEFYLDVFRGIITSSPAAQMIESGRLIITSRRVLFVGANRTLAISYDLITGMDLFMDMLRINSVGKDRVCVFGFENPPLAALAISYAYRETSG